MSIDIALDAADLTRLPSRTRPEAAELAILHGKNPADGELMVYFHQGALREVDDHGRSDRANEVGGFLLGTPILEEGRLSIEVVAALPAATGDHGPVHFTLTADSWAQAHRQREADFPELQIVGWFHTHPNLGVFFSADDCLVHQTAFTLPWQIGLVLDPIRNEASCFGWDIEERAIIPVSGFFELRLESQYSVVTWRAAVNTGLAGWWQRMAGEASEAIEESLLPAPWDVQNQMDGPLRRGLFSGVVALLVSGLVVSMLFIPLIRRNNELEQALASILQSQHAPLYAAEGLACPANGLLLTQPEIGQMFQVGETINFWGIADQDWASRYQIEARRLGSGPADPFAIWQVIDTRRLDQPLGSIGRWSTAGLEPGRYEIRLVAVMRGSLPVLDGACHTRIELVQPASARAIFEN